MNVEASGFELSTPPPAKPKRAMILAAGLGQRMRPLTDTMPKPLIEVAGSALIDYAFDRLEHAGVGEVVVNVHYLAALLKEHIANRRGRPVAISDETDGLLDTGGGVARALDHFGDQPFYLLNGDSFWVDGVTRNLDLMADSWRDGDMDALLLLSPTVDAVGYGGPGDFLLDPSGSIRRRPERQVAPFVYAGAAILHPRFFEKCPAAPFSLNTLFDRAIAGGRLHGVRLEGQWLHVGTPEAIPAAEQALADGAT